MNANSLLFAPMPIIVDEDCAAVVVDIERPIAHAHTNRDAFAIAADVGAPVR
ncbi:MAG: hypothetical protein J2P21_07020 [Chloracidobacterium sp.]|nr:hypothetical protein [Chloracidobacterium sp.]